MCKGHHEGEIRVNNNSKIRAFQKKTDIYSQWKNVEDKEKKIPSKENTTTTTTKISSKQFSKTSANLFFSTGVVIFMPSPA